MLKQNGLVGPKGHFLLGHLLEFRKDPLTFLTQSAQGYGEIVPLRLLHLPVYLINNPEHIEYILGTHSRDFVKSRLYKVGSTLLGNGLAMSEGDFWLRQRRLMQPAFHREHIHAYGQMMVDYTERMLATWRDGQVLEVYQAMLNLTLAIATKTLFNSELDNDSEGIKKALGFIMEEMTKRFTNVIPIPEGVPTPDNRRYQKAIRELDEVVYGIIQRRRATSDDTGDLLSMLLKAKDEDGSMMTDRQLRDETITILAGGFETNGGALAWSWYLLSQHPEVEAKLHAELEAVLGGRVPTLDDLPKLRYTEMVYLEALRLYTPGPLLGREAIKDFEIGGHHFPAGTELWISPWGLHRSPRYFEAPDEFRPERWENDLVKRLPKFAYFPFSHGPRVCIGQAFASIEAKLVLATVVQRFRLKLAPGQVVEPEVAFTVRPKYGLKMSLTERRSAP